MSRRHLIHRDEALLQLGRMPKSLPAATFEHRKAIAASKMARDLDLDQFPIADTRALRYDQAQVDREAQKIKPLQRAA